MLKGLAMTAGQSSSLRSIQAVFWGNICAVLYCSQHYRVFKLKRSWNTYQTFILLPQLEMQPRTQTLSTTLGYDFA
jgi:hypothetical protein